MAPPPEILRDRVARIVAATRFPFVDQENWDEDRRTLVNTRRERAHPVEHPGGALYPSVVVLDPDGSIREIGEVETRVDAGLVPKWRILSGAASVGERYRKLFIYVPKGEGEEAVRLLEENGVEYAGLREWSVEDGVLATRPVRTPDMAYDHRVS